LPCPKLRSRPCGAHRARERIPAPAKRCTRPAPSARRMSPAGPGLRVTRSLAGGISPGPRGWAYSRRHRVAAPLARRQRRALPWARAARAGPQPPDSPDQYGSFVTQTGSKLPQSFPIGPMLSAARRYVDGPSLCLSGAPPPTPRKSGLIVPALNRPAGFVRESGRETLHPDAGNPAPRASATITTRTTTTQPVFGDPEFRRARGLAPGPPLSASHQSRQGRL
jgi:hypothetical protein